MQIKIQLRNYRDFIVLQSLFPMYMNHGRYFKDEDFGNYGCNNTVINFNTLTKRWDWMNYYEDSTEAKRLDEIFNTSPLNSQILITLSTSSRSGKTESFDKPLLIANYTTTIDAVNQLEELTAEESHYPGKDDKILTLWLLEADKKAAILDHRRIKLADLSP